MEDKAKSTSSVEGTPIDMGKRTQGDVVARDWCRIPCLSKALVEEMAECRNIYTHCCNKCTVITSGTHMLPGSSNTWGGIEVRPGEVCTVCISLSYTFLPPA